MQKICDPCNADAFKFLQQKEDGYPLLQPDLPYTLRRIQEFCCQAYLSE